MLYTLAVILLIAWLLGVRSLVRFLGAGQSRPELQSKIAVNQAEQIERRRTGGRFDVAPGAA